MKRISVVLLSLVFSASAIGAGDILQQLGVSRADATNDIVSSLGYGSVSYYRVRDAFKAASPATRAVMVEQVLVWTKSYVSSPQFAKEYVAWRDQQKPRSREPQMSVDEELKQRHAKQAAELEETKKNIAGMPVEYRKAAEEGYKAAVEAMKQMDTPEFRKIEREALEAERRSEKEEYESATKEWAEKYPADSRSLVARRLREFLGETADVDFTAKLVDANGHKRFANPDYESKSSNWKLAYRAGREATEKARAFAKAWLADLGSVH